MANCLFCYQPVQEEGLEYHAVCCKRFFGVPRMPEVRLDKKLLADLADQTVNKRIAVTGVQPKLSVNLEKEKSGPERLTIVGLWGRYILKPQHNEFLYMPETEDLTMHLANQFRIKTCEHALIRTTEGSLAYLAKRFDRLKDEKLHVEDFCQLSGFLTEQKYKGSYEKIGKLIQLYCKNKQLDALNFFELVLFSFLSGNNDMHLKNFSVVHDNEGIALSPAYDLLNVNLVFPDDKEELGLTLNGKKRKINRTDFAALGKSLNLPARAVENIYNKFKDSSEKASNVISSSFLPEDWKVRYLEIWNQKIATLF
jgi:serine/threonine-protein kinase HipA